MPVNDLGTILTMPANRSLGDDIAGSLRTAILSGHFGPGERLREEAIARSMGVSRGPVREALVQLTREGLVATRRNRGAFVAQLSRQDLDEVYTLRVVLERLAVQRTVALGDDQALAIMQEIIDAMASRAAERITEQEAAELDIEFHEQIFRASNHRRLYECWTNLRPQIHILLLNRNVAHADFRDHAVISHQEVLDAMRQRDEGPAVRLIEVHLRGSYERVVASYERRLGMSSESGSGADTFGQLGGSDRAE
jgi:DNA-binding GntR family transcriptional regulator